MFQRFHGGEIKKWVLMGGAIGGLCGILGLIEPEAAGGGFNLIPIAAAGNFGVGLLLFIFITRVVTTLLCFSSGAPGEFSPRCWRWERCLVRPSVWRRQCFSRSITWRLVLLRLPGWGALMAASVRAPLTGIVLVLEMTDNYQLILPMIITLPWRDTISPVFGRETVILNHPGAHSGEAGMRNRRRKARMRLRARILERITRVLDNDCQYWVEIYPITDVVWSKI